MTLVVLRRPERMRPPAVPDDPVKIVAAPTRGEGIPSSSYIQLLLPLMTGISGLMFMLNDPKPLFIVIGATMAFGSIGMSVSMFIQMRSSATRRSKVEGAQYRRYLRSMRDQLGATAQLQDLAARFTHPNLAGRWAVCCASVRVWERRGDHPDFVSVRIGRGPVPLRTKLALEETDNPFVERHPDLVAEAEALIAGHGDVADQPVVIDLRETPVVSVVGPSGVGRAVAVNMVTELATFCSPTELIIAVCHPAGVAHDWDFVKWLPHAFLDDTVLLFPDGRGFTDQLGAEIERRRELARRRHGLTVEWSPGSGTLRLVVVADGFGPASVLACRDQVAVLAEQAASLDISVVCCVEAQRDEPPRVDARVRAGERWSFALEAGGRTQLGRLDAVDPVLCACIARRLAPLRLDASDSGDSLVCSHRLVELLGSPSAAEFDVRRMWHSLAPPHGVLRVPIGAGADGRPEVLDLKESALGGMGPHGLVVGATGSGKSELLRTIVTGLALTHPPDVLGFALVDFKGGAAFAGLADLPHVAGLITNLADDLSMVDRMYLALFGEQERRQRLLRDAGDIDNVREYQRRRAAGLLGDAPPLPYLLIVVDEFGELLSTRADFVDLFVAIGRLGRSLGMHLLLSSQRVEEGRLRGLESHISYRICLRTFSTAESNAVIGRPDAYHLPPEPGSAYLKVDTTIFERFRAALVTAPDRPSGTDAPVHQPSFFSPVTAGSRAPKVNPAVDAPVVEPAAAITEMEESVARIRATGVAGSHKVWLAPLESTIPLHHVLGPRASDARRGLQASSWPGLGRASAPVGLLDLPRQQLQRAFPVDLAGWAGHLVVVGAPQTGKSTLLRTLLLSTFVTNTPDELRAYVIDFSGGGLQVLSGAPHVGCVSGRLEIDQARRTLRQVHKLIDERDAKHRELGIDSPQAMRERRTTMVAPDLTSDVVLVIDGWGAARAELEDLEPLVVEIAERGLRVGVHLVITANRWQEVRPQLRDNIGGRLELRLNDPSDSMISRKASAALPTAKPGRALTAEGDQVQIALPDLGCSIEQAVEKMRNAWPGRAAPRVRLLPALVTVDELPSPDHDLAPGVPIGIDEADLAPVYLNLCGSDSHFLLLGDSESGKSSFLRTWMAGLQARRGPNQAMFLVVDYQRALLGTARPEQTWAYCGGAPAAEAAVRELVSGIVERFAPATVTPEALAARSWWQGPDIYVVVDDYDLVASPSGNPLSPLVEVLAQGRDIGLHLVMARRVGGMSRSGFEPVLTRMRELRQPGLLLSGDPSEGPLLGNERAVPQPPGRGILVRRRHAPITIQVAGPDSLRTTTGSLKLAG